MSLSSTSRLVLVSDVPSFIFFVVWCLLSFPISSSGRGCVLIVLYVFGFWFRFRAWAFVSCRFVFFLWGRVCVSPGARSCFWLGLWLSSVSGFFWGAFVFGV